MKPALTTTLFVIFAILKLLSIIAWPWVWVLAPIWIMGLLSTPILLFTEHVVPGGKKLLKVLLIKRFPYVLEDL